MEVCGENSISCHTCASSRYHILPNFKDGLKSTPFSLTCEVADNVLECFAKVKAEIAKIQ